MKSIPRYFSSRVCLPDEISFLGTESELANRYPASLIFRSNGYHYMMSMHHIGDYRALAKAMEILKEYKRLIPDELALFALHLNAERPDADPEQRRMFRSLFHFESFMRSIDEQRCCSIEPISEFEYERMKWEYKLEYENK